METVTSPPRTGESVKTWFVTLPYNQVTVILPSHPVPVDKLLFLRGRAGVKHTEKAMLLSSEAGVIRWWNIFANRPEMGEMDTPLVSSSQLAA